MYALELSDDHLPRARLFVLLKKHKDHTRLIENSEFCLLFLVTRATKFTGLSTQLASLFSAQSQKTPYCVEPAFRFIHENKSVVHGAILSFDSS
jgi:hypothetical protein